jgi:hypothetical protein
MIGWSIQMRTQSRTQTHLLVAQMLRLLFRVVALLACSGGIQPRHTIVCGDTRGLDIFGGGESGTVAVYAVYDGFLSRLDDWRSTVVIRHNDPLEEGRTIWTYYTHMASEDGTSYIDDAFPMETYNKPITQGTLLGWQYPSFTDKKFVSNNAVQIAQD